ncbi:Serine/threonine-protein kinase PrkC [Pirellulimonas nuda]|uniref:Serine/threonine-protein kinase PrkC n=1 Tax=Pirellulimonas nuda TaxID=2528009 RepID=A0A518DAH7_9BACT|nr:serine/threonine-protein kinase [Pirellulimonas nuda]QDU88479.1 Serine/threonine-protein kinase PrkC [Pirellulimonas nuda]
MSKTEKYLATDRLGSGPTCDVYLGRDSAGADRKVAIKRLRDDGRLNAAIREPFFAAAQRWSELTHDGLVGLYEVDRADGAVIYQPRPNTAARLLAAAPTSGERVVAWLGQTAAGLEHLHGQGLLHLNIKPTNLLVDDQDRAALIDGRCLPAAKPGELQLARGNMKYLAPEVIDADCGKIGPATDIFALGMVLLELLIGPKFDDLYRGVGVDAIDPERTWLRWQAGRDEPLPEIALQAPNAPPALQGLLARMLAKNPGHRAEQAGEILRALGVTPSPPGAAVSANQPRTTATPIGAGPLPTLQDIPGRPTAPVVLRFLGCQAEMIGVNQDVFTLGPGPDADFPMPPEVQPSGGAALRFGRGAEGWRVNSPGGAGFYLNQDFVPSSAALRSGDVVRFRPSSAGLQFTILNQNVESLAKLASQFAPRLVQQAPESDAAASAMSPTTTEPVPEASSDRWTWAVWWVAVGVLLAAALAFGQWAWFSGSDVAPVPVQPVEPTPPGANTLVIPPEIEIPVDPAPPATVDPAAADPATVDPAAADPAAIKPAPAKPKPTVPDASVLEL